MEKDQKENIQNENLAKEENNQSSKPQDQTVKEMKNLFYMMVHLMQMEIYTWGQL